MTVFCLDVLLIYTSDIRQLLYSLTSPKTVDMATTMVAKPLVFLSSLDIPTRIMCNEIAKE